MSVARALLRGESAPAAWLRVMHRRVAVRRYIEVGVFTAWTCAFVSTYLRRVGPLDAFRGFAVDITSTAMAQGTRNLVSSRAPRTRDLCSPAAPPHVPRKKLAPQRRARERGVSDARAKDGQGSCAIAHR